MEDVFDKMFQEIHGQMFDTFFKPQKYNQQKEHVHMPNMKGFSIKISSNSETGAPQINVQELGTPMQKYREMAPRPHHNHPRRTAPKETAEPKSHINKLPGKQFIEIELPGVKSIDDIDIIEGEESVEIRAYKGDTMFFKIMQIEQGQRVQNRQFKNGMLHLEVGR